MKKVVKSFPTEVCQDLQGSPPTTELTPSPQRVTAAEYTTGRAARPAPPAQLRQPRPCRAAGRAEPAAPPAPSGAAAPHKPVPTLSSCSPRDRPEPPRGGRHWGRSVACPPPAPRTSLRRRGPSAQRQTRAAAAAPSSSPRRTAGASRAGSACSERAQNCSPNARRQPSAAAIGPGLQRVE